MTMVHVICVTTFWWLGHASCYCVTVVFQNHPVSTTLNRIRNDLCQYFIACTKYHLLFLYQTQTISKPPHHKLEFDGVVDVLLTHRPIEYTYIWQQRCVYIADELYTYNSNAYVPQYNTYSGEKRKKNTHIFCWKQTDIGCVFASSIMFSVYVAMVFCLFILKITFASENQKSIENMSWMNANTQSVTHSLTLSLPRTIHFYCIQSVETILAMKW